MKKIFLFLFISSFFYFQGCKNDKGMLPNASHAPDTIVYHDIVPDTTFTSTGPRLCCNPYAFLCRDSTCNYQLDVDADGVTDFQFVSQVQYVNYGGPTNSNVESYFCGINSVNSYDGALRSSDYGSSVFAGIDSLGDVISNSLNYDSSPYIYFEHPRIGLFGTNNTDKYIGFKIVRHNKNYFGWILFSNIQNKMTIKSWAINKTANNSILAGQIH